MVSKIDRQAFLQSLIVPPGKEISLHKDYDPGFKPDYITKEDATLLLQQGIEKMAEFQDKLYAQDTYALLINLQAMVGSLVYYPSRPQMVYPFSCGGGYLSHPRIPGFKISHRHRRTSPSFTESQRNPRKRARLKMEENPQKAIIAGKSIV